MENSPFGKLSPELRNAIYELALTANQLLTICCKGAAKGATRDGQTAIQPPLTRVCRQAREESLMMFYHANTFLIVVTGPIYKKRFPIRDPRVVINMTSLLPTSTSTDWGALCDALKCYGYYAQHQQEQKLDVTFVRIISATPQEHLFLAITMESQRHAKEWAALFFNVHAWQSLIETLIKYGYGGNNRGGTRLAGSGGAVALGLSSFTVGGLCNHQGSPGKVSPAAGDKGEEEIRRTRFRGYGDIGIVTMLPAEIRNDIYKLVLKADKPLAICSKSPDLYTAAQPPITRVCSQIRAETLQMFYHSNTFSAEIMSDVHWNASPDDDVIQRADEIEEWFRCTSPKYLGGIRHLWLVIVSPESCELSYNRKDWQDLVQTLERLGLVGSEGKGKMEAAVWLDSRSREGPNYYRRRAEETRRFFERLGLEVGVEIMHG
ncbi:hypothetical protein CERZMDRAFT_101276 [Cercospora zeae-maydis SCOH1-5]|uniref:2EXR domain-containing protein n=1 Tax=Cercospora zeae-maydis SCOH1-5 TaxID=717836 RepID=A0A6A6F7S9_9PEZI|nr:hypothetical protein CERZMDRAFT_101276 [Cercospora zeae-maydis SCOH1-5]